MTPDVEIRLRDMLTYAQGAISLLDRHGEAGVRAEWGLELGLIKAVEIIGEAASRISTPERPELDGLPWPAVIGLRHHLVHGYGKVRLDAIFRVVRDNLPTLVASLERLLGERST